VDDFDAGIAQAGLGETGIDFVAAADEVQFGDFVIGLKRLFGAFNDDPGPVVAAHDIHHDAHKRKERRGSYVRPRS
jgi:hypothetical protein